MPPFVMKLLRRSRRALVPQDDPEPTGEERRFAEALRECGGREVRLLEDLPVRKERDRRPGAFGRADLLHLALRHAPCELLPVEGAVTPHLGDQPFGESVDHRDADAVQTAGDLVPVAAELAPGVKLREHDGESREPLLFDHVDRNASTVIDDGYRIVGMDRDVDRVIATGECLVDRVVDDLVDEMVEAPRTCRSDVHPGAEPYRLEAFQDRDVLRGVVRLGHAGGIPFTQQKSPANRAFCGSSQSIRNGGRRWPLRDSPRPRGRS